jgi:multicomponent Na+:H+ antiporter subunit G
MTDWIAFIALITGALFVLVSAIGLLRLPDLFMRMHATTKTTSLGITLILIGVLITFPTWSVLLKGLLIIAFIFLTSPLGAHMISKAGYLLGIKKWDRYVRDDLNRDHHLSQE